MSITRGYIGKRGAGYEIGFSKAGYDYLTATPDQLIFRTDIEQLRPLLIGWVNVGNGSTVSVGLTKTFTQLPWVFVMADYGEHLRTPNDTIVVTMFFNDNNFFIKNLTGATRRFYYAVFDNDQGQLNLF